MDTCKIGIHSLIQQRPKLLMEKAIHLELRYPNLALTEYAVTSPKSQEYNCFAWVAGDQEHWWQPTPEDEFYWLPGVPMEETLSAYIQAYQTL